jgi:hypothetical protein
VGIVPVRAASSRRRSWSALSKSIKKLRSVGIKTKPGLAISSKLRWQIEDNGIALKSPRWRKLRWPYCKSSRNFQSPTQLNQVLKTTHFAILPPNNMADV